MKLAFRLDYGTYAAGNSALAKPLRLRRLFPVVKDYLGVCEFCFKARWVGTGERILLKGMFAFLRPGLTWGYFLNALQDVGTVQRKFNVERNTVIPSYFRVRKQSILVFRF